jgi:hypothetical protein
MRNERHISENLVIAHVRRLCEFIIRCINCTIGSQPETPHTTGLKTEIDSEALDCVVGDIVCLFLLADLILYPYHGRDPG